MYNDIKVLLGKKVKEIRTKRGLTQEELAEKIGISQKNLSKIECGKSFVTSETLNNILNSLNIKAKELFDFDCYQNNKMLKNEMIEAIKNDSVNIKLLYKFFSVIK